MWSQPNGSMSDKSAREEFCLTQEEIENGIREGKLQYRRNYMHGNPYLKLLRNEVESYAKDLYGEDYVNSKRAEKELKDINREMGSLKRKLLNLEKRKKELLSLVGT